MSITEFRYVRQATPGTRSTVTWAELCERLTRFQVAESKERIALFSPFTYAADKRSASGAERAGVLVLDFDGAGDENRGKVWTTPGHVLSTLGDFAGVLHSSHSYEPDKPKLRVVLLLSRGVTPAEYKRVYRWVVRLVGENRHDITAERAVQCFYYPSHKPGVPCVAERFGSRVVDVDAALAEVPEDTSEIVSVAPQSAVAKVFRVLQELGHPMRPKGNGAWLIVCPWQAEHSSQKPLAEDTSTLLYEAGGFRCHHSHCEGKGKEDVETWLHDIHPEAWVGSSREAPPLRAPATGLSDMPPLEAAENAPEILHSLLRFGKSESNPTVFLRITPGAGKTHEGVAYLREVSLNHFVTETVRCVYSSPRHNLNREVLEKHLVGAGYDAAWIHAPVAITYDDKCRKRKVGLKLAGAPVAARDMLCDACEFRKDYDGRGSACPAYERARDDKSRQERPIQVKTHATLALDLRRARERDVVFIDEQPPLVSEVELTESALQALETAARHYFSKARAEEVREIVESLREAMRQRGRAVDLPPFAGPVRA